MSDDNLPPSRKPSPKQRLCRILYMTRNPEHKAKQGTSRPKTKAASCVEARIGIQSAPNLRNLLPSLETKGRWKIKTKVRPLTHPVEAWPS